MKILALYSYFESFTMNHWLNIDFLRYFNNNDGVELKVYGLRVEQGYPDVAVCDYDPKIKLEDIYRKFDFDLIVIYTKSRMFADYLPPLQVNNKERIELRVGCWMPSDFSNWKKTPKIAFEEDYHYEINDDWYDELGFDLILQRHYTHSKRKGKVRSEWLPFSVDINYFKPQVIEKRTRKISFNGSESAVYIYRNKIRKMLDSSILDDHQFYRKEKHYIWCLQNYVANLCGSSLYYITPAKMFEIMACGSVLWTNASANYGLDELFPRDAYCTYNDTFTDVHQTVKKLLYEDEWRQSIADKGLECIRSRHTHEIRIKEFLEVVKSL